MKSKLIWKATLGDRIVGQAIWNLPKFDAGGAGGAALPVEGKEKAPKTWPDRTNVELADRFSNFLNAHVENISHPHYREYFHSWFASRNVRPCQI